MPQNHAQQVIEIMCDPSGKLSDYFDLLRLQQLGLKLFSLGYIRKQAVGVPVPFYLIDHDGPIMPPHPVSVPMLNPILDIEWAIFLE